MDKAARTRWLIRGTSLVFAIILWYFVAWDSSGLTVRDFRVPVQFQGVTEGYSLSGNVQTVEVRIRGSGFDLARLDPGEIIAQIGISDLRPGKYRLPIQVTLPGHLWLVNHNPKFIELELFRMIERAFNPVLVPHDMPPNLMLSNVDITPPEVSVRGPEALVTALRRAEARGTMRELSDGPLELPVILVGENGDLRDLVSEPPTVTVNAQFTTMMDEARIPIRARVTGTPTPGFEVANIVLSPDVVTLRGTSEALLGVTELRLNPIDVTGHDENMTIDMPLESPSEAITIIDADHVIMKVEFRASMESRTFFGVPIIITGVPYPSNWAITPRTASVTVEHPVFGAAQGPDDPPLELYIDATNVVTSQLTLPILVRNVMGGVSVIRIEPPQATITEIN